MKILMRRCMLGVLALTIIACATQSSGGTLQAGMSADQAAVAMGPPDLRDEVADPNHNGAKVLRYTWLDAGKSATFGSDQRVATIDNIGSSPSTLSEAAQEQRSSNAPPFDLQTPFDYAFYPFRAAMVFFGAGLNCVGGGGCHQPRLPPVSPG